MHPYNEIFSNFLIYHLRSGFMIKMNKNLILLTGILLLLAITGCDKFGKKGQTPISEADLRKAKQ